MKNQIELLYPLNVGLFISSILAEFHVLEVEHQVYTFVSI